MCRGCQPSASRQRVTICMPAGFSSRSFGKSNRCRTQCGSDVQRRPVVSLRPALHRIVPGGVIILVKPPQPRRQIFIQHAALGPLLLQRNPDTRAPLPDPAPPHPPAAPGAPGGNPSHAAGSSGIPAPPRAETRHPRLAVIRERHPDHPRVQRIPILRNIDGNHFPLPRHRRPHMHGGELHRHLGQAARPSP